MSKGQHVGWRDWTEADDDWLADDVDDNVVIDDDPYNLEDPAPQAHPTPALRPPEPTPASTRPATPRPRRRRLILLSLLSLLLIFAFLASLATGYLRGQPAGDAPAPVELNEVQPGSGTGL